MGSWKTDRYWEFWMVREMDALNSNSAGSMAPTRSSLCFHWRVIIVLLLYTELRQYSNSPDEAVHLSLYTEHKILHLSQWGGLACHWLHQGNTKESQVVSPHCPQIPKFLYIWQPTSQTMWKAGSSCISLWVHAKRHPDFLSTLKNRKLWFCSIQAGGLLLSFHRPESCRVEYADTDCLSTYMHFQCTDGTKWVCVKLSCYSATRVQLQNYLITNYMLVNA